MNNNTESFGEYIWDNLFYAAVGFIYYKNLLFRCIDGLSYDQSRVVLISIILITGSLGIIVNIDWNRNGSSTFANIVLPFGVYTVFTYMPVNKRTFLIVSACASVVSALHAILIMCRRIKNKKRACSILRNRIRNVLSRTHFYFATGLACAMFLVGVGPLIGSSILQPTVVATTYKETDEQTIDRNINSVLLLRGDAWKDLSVPERLDVLQTVANIERRYLGIPHELNVGVANIGEYVLGYYDNNTHEIIISLDSLMTDPPEEVLNTVCHEAYHGYQHCIVSALESTSAESRNLILFRDARIYAEEFCNYKSGSHGFSDYYYQDCEIDARKYAEEAVTDYYRRIEEFITEKSANQ